MRLAKFGIGAKGKAFPSTSEVWGNELTTDILNRRKNTYIYDVQ
jgi:hypothetical protein